MKRLPFQPSSEAFRKFALAQKQLKYKYDFTCIESLAMLKGLPFDEFPSANWLFSVVNTARRLRENISKLPHNNKKELDNFSDILTESTNPIPNELIEEFKALSVDGIDGDGINWAEYENIFTTIELPNISINQRFLEDDEFVWMRLAGSNPLVIKGVSKLENKFPVTEEHYQSVVAGDTLDKATKEGRLYIADYLIFENFQTGITDGRKKYVSAPIVLFALPPSPEKSLVVVAIQCGQDPNLNPIITPPKNNASDSEIWAWKIAKTIVQIADSNYHELISHLGLTHLFIEPFAIATERQLSEQHPLGILLRQHFEGTLLINFLAGKFLVNKDQPLDNLQAGSYETSRNFSAKAVSDFKFNDNILPDTFINRKVNNLTNYPYREDSLLIWEAINQWVSDYLIIYYQNDNEVEADDELQSWAKEIISPDGGRINGFGEGQGIKTLAYLIKATTQIIFTASAQHAAVNFSQPYWMSYTPIMPMSGYTPIPNNFKNVSSQDYFNLLPPVKRAVSQLELTYLLGSVYHTNLGNYDAVFSDRKVQSALEKFQTRLKDIEKIIENRNKNRLIPYEFLLPSRIPQSINI